MKGFSRANLMYMRAFAEAWPDEPIVQQLVGRLPWGHNLVLLTKLKAREERQKYAERAIEHGWSRNVLAIHIDRAAPVQDTKSRGRRVRPARLEQAHRRGRVPTGQRPAGRALDRAAQHRADRERDGGVNRSLYVAIVISF
jgi:hypothetical protein